MKRIVAELKSRDDYEARMNQVECSTCGREANRPEYRIFGEKEWKSAFQELKVDCSECANQKELAKIMNTNKRNLREIIKERFEKDYWIIPPDLLSAGFKNFKTNNNSVFEAKRAVMEYVKTFDSNPESRYNLLLMGNSGAGKSHLAVTKARTLKEKGFIVGFLTSGTLLTKIQDTWKEKDHQSKEKIYKDLEMFELLVIDDIGSEAKSASEYDWSKKELFEIVERRKCKPTIYTSNFNIEHLPTAIGEKVFSRLHYNTKFIEIVTEVYRKSKRI